MMRFRWLITASIAATLLSGCSSATPTATPAAPTAAPAATAAGEQPGYPAPSAVATGGYPMPTMPSSDPGYPVPTAEPGPNYVESLTVPTPSSSEVGVVTGFFYRLAPGATEGGEPFPADLFLGEVINTTGGEAAMVALDQGTAPRAKIDGKGLFVFSDVKPGLYGLMVNAPGGSLLLNNPSDGSAMVIEVTANSTVDLGQLSYDLGDALP